MSVIYTVGWFVSSFTGDLMLVFNYFATGQYVNDTDNQKKYFEEPLTPEEVIGRYIDALLAEKKAAENASQS